jgi:hypothetical protein
MILSFNIEYRTNWGEEVRISGLFPESIPLHTTDGIYWTAEVELEIPHEGMIINYNWDVMEKDGYRWWMKRFQKMAEYFDAYRIDHILGFFFFV